MTVRGRAGFAFLEMRNFIDMPCRMGELKSDALAMPARREAAALYDRDLVRHVGVLRIVGDAVDARLRHDLAGTKLLRHCLLQCRSFAFGTGHVRVTFRASRSRPMFAGSM